MISAGPQLLELTFRTIDGQVVGTTAAVGSTPPELRQPLLARQLQLADGTEVTQVMLAGTDKAAGYERIDNEILAGLRLARLAAAGKDADVYPREASRLLGYDSDSADPFALLLPYLGEPVGVGGRRLLPVQQARFQVGLLRALRWLAAAGIAHRGISPYTVRWDGNDGQVQITDFSLATVFGVPREPAGTPPWAAPEQRPGRATGHVGEHDDLWAAGRLIYFVCTGQELARPQQLADSPGLDALLADVFGPPERRPTALELLRRLNVPDPVPPGLNADPLEAGRARFQAIRAARHPGLAPSASPGESRDQAARQEDADRAAAERAPRRRTGLTVGALALIVVIAAIMLASFR